LEPRAAGKVANDYWAFGPSWCVEILPYGEHAQAFTSIRKLTQGGTTAIDYHVADTSLQSQLPMFWCPSGDLDMFQLVRNANAMQSCYGGISGADNDPKVRISSGKIRYCDNNSKSAILSAGGVLFPNANIAAEKITDGTSKTLLVAECSGSFTDPVLGRVKWSVTGKDAQKTSEMKQGG
jgi:hypothetical protein